MILAWHHRFFGCHSRLSRYPSILLRLCSHIQCRLCVCDCRVAAVAAVAAAARLSCECVFFVRALFRPDLSFLLIVCMSFFSPIHAWNWANGKDQYEFLFFLLFSVGLYHSMCHTNQCTANDARNNAVLSRWSYIFPNPYQKKKTEEQKKRIIVACSSCHLCATRDGCSL